jgi:hypothetical protein
MANYQGGLEMKRIFIVLMVVVGLAFTSPAFGAARLLTNATTTGEGRSLKLENADTHVFVATFANTSTFVLVAEGYDGYTWTTLGTYTIDAADISAGKFRWDVNSRLTDEIRPNITTLTGGGATVSVTGDSK